MSIPPLQRIYLLVTNNFLRSIQMDNLLKSHTLPTHPRSLRMSGVRGVAHAEPNVSRPRPLPSPPMRKERAWVGQPTGGGDQRAKRRRAAPAIASSPVPSRAMLDGSGVGEGAMSEMVSVAESGLRE